MRRHLQKVFGSILLIVLTVGAITALSPSMAQAMGKPGGGKCGECPCQPEICGGGICCVLESCHLLFPKDCLWDCHYVCPFPG